MHCILTSDRYLRDSKFSFLPQTFSSLWVLCEDGQTVDKSFRAGWWDIVLCWSCECYLYCVKEQWAKNHLVHLYSWSKNKDFRTESLATGSVSPPRQKPNEMQHLDHEWTVSDEQDAWLNSLEKMRNGEVQEVKKTSVIALLSEIRPHSRGKKKIRTLLVPNLQSCNPARSVKAVVLPHPFAHFSTALHLPLLTLPLFIYLQQVIKHSQHLAEYSIRPFWGCLWQSLALPSKNVWNKHLAKHQIWCLSSLRQCSGCCFNCFSWLPWFHVMSTADPYQTYGPVTCKTQMDSLHLLKCKQLFGR